MRPWPPRQAADGLLRLLLCPPGALRGGDPGASFGTHGPFLPWSLRGSSHGRRLCAALTELAHLAFWAAAIFARAAADLLPLRPSTGFALTGSAIEDSAAPPKISLSDPLSASICLRMLRAFSMVAMGRSQNELVMICFVFFTLKTQFRLVVHELDSILFDSPRPDSSRSRNHLRLATLPPDSAASSRHPHVIFGLDRMARRLEILAHIPHIHSIRQGIHPSATIFIRVPGLVEFDFPPQRAGNGGVGLGFGQLQCLSRRLDRVGKLSSRGIGGG